MHLFLYSAEKENRDYYIQEAVYVPDCSKRNIGR